MASTDSYPDGTVEKLLQTDFVSPATKTAIEPRLTVKNADPAALGTGGFKILRIICNHLLALTGDYPSVNIALEIDARLAAGHSSGWRYQEMPEDRGAYVQALIGIEETAEIMYQASFEKLEPDNQVAVLQLIQKGEAAGAVWTHLSSKHFFEELLTEVTEIFYSYPYAQNEIGYTGMADMHGWSKIGLNEPEEPEPKEQFNNTSL